MDLEYKTSGVAVVTDDRYGKGEGNLVKGWLTRFNTVDLGSDMTVPGSFLDTIQKNPHPVILWSHDHTQLPLGKVRAWSEVGTEGVFIIGELTPGVQQAEEVGRLVKAGALSGLSYGYTVDRSSPSFQNSKRVRKLERVSVMEVSVCNFPMHPDARLVGTEGKDLLTIGEVETLRKCGFHVTSRQMVAYIDALERQADRVLWGMTRDEREEKRLSMLALIDKELRS